MAAAAILDFQKFKILTVDVLPSVNVDRSKVEHLDPEQQGELLALLDEFALSVSAINQVYAGLLSTKFGSQVIFNQNG